MFWIDGAGAAPQRQADVEVEVRLPLEAGRGESIQLNPARDAEPAKPSPEPSTSTPAPVAGTDDALSSFPARGSQTQGHGHGRHNSPMTRTSRSGAGGIARDVARARTGPAVCGAREGMALRPTLSRSIVWLCPSGRRPACPGLDAAFPAPRLTSRRLGQRLKAAGTAVMPPASRSRALWCRRSAPPPLRPIRSGRCLV